MLHNKNARKVTISLNPRLVHVACSLPFRQWDMATADDGLLTSC